MFVQTIYLHIMRIDNTHYGHPPPWIELGAGNYTSLISIALLGISEKFHYSNPGSIRSAYMIVTPPKVRFLVTPLCSHISQTNEVYNYLLNVCVT